jgi:hypothetical protein
MTEASITPNIHLLTDDKCERGTVMKYLVTTINKSENSQFKVNTPYTFLHVTDLEVLLGEDNIILPFSIFFLRVFDMVL